MCMVHYYCSAYALLHYYLFWFIIILLELLIIAKIKYIPKLYIYNIKHNLDIITVIITVI